MGEGGVQDEVVVSDWLPGVREELLPDGEAVIPASAGDKNPQEKTDAEAVEDEHDVGAAVPWSFVILFTNSNYITWRIISLTRATLFKPYLICFFIVSLESFCFVVKFSR